MTKKEKRFSINYLKKYINRELLNKELKELNTKLNTITAVEDVEKLHPANLRKYSILMYRKIQVLEKLN